MTVALLWLRGWSDPDTAPSGQSGWAIGPVRYSQTSARCEAEPVSRTCLGWNADPGSHRGRNGAGSYVLSREFTSRILTLWPRADLNHVRTTCRTDGTCKQFLR